MGVRGKGWGEGYVYDVYWIFSGLTDVEPFCDQKVEVFALDLSEKGGDMSSNLR